MLREASLDLQRPAANLVSLSLRQVTDLLQVHVERDDEHSDPPTFEDFGIQVADEAERRGYPAAEMACSASCGSWTRIK